MKMRKKINKLISTLLAVELIFSMCYVPIQANENSSDIVILDDGYEIGDGEVSDWVKFIDYDGQTAVLKTIVTSDNHSYIISEKSGQTKCSSGGEINYKKYIFDLLHPQNTVPHASNQPVITPYGSEITGSQYKHVRIADAIVELNTEDMAALGFMGVEAVIELFEKK